MDTYNRDSDGRFAPKGTGDRTEFEKGFSKGMPKPPKEGAIDKNSLGGFSTYSMAISDDEDERDWLREKHGIRGEVRQTSPREYFEESADLFGVTVDELKEQRRDDSLGYHIDRISKGGKVPMPFLFKGNGQQEGLHRMYALGEIYGWDEKFPVLWLEKEAKRNG